MNLLENVNARAKQLNHSDPYFADRIYDAMAFASNEFESLGLLTGFHLLEKSSPLTIEKAVDQLKADPIFAKLEDRDLGDLAKYFIDHGAGSIIFAPDIISTFIDFSKHVGFPVTLGGAERGGLAAPRYNAKTLLRVLIGAHVLTVSEVPARDAMKAKHSGEEIKFFKENPDMKVDVYEYDAGFLREVGYVLRTLGVKEESINQKGFLKVLAERLETDMIPDKKLEELESRINKLSHGLGEKDSKEPEEPEETTDVSDHESKIFKEIDDDTVERMVDGLLVVLGEMEQTGAISRIESPDQARDAVMAVVRRMYQKRGLITKMSRKFSRFGSARVLKKAGQEIRKALK